jgi:hypothetical protein
MCGSPLGGTPWARTVDARPDLAPAIGRHVVVGDEAPDLKIAPIVAVDTDGNVAFEVLAGSGESPSDAPLDAERRRCTELTAGRLWRVRLRGTTDAVMPRGHDRPPREGANRVVSLALPS